MKHLLGRPLIERKCVYTTHIGDDNEVEREYAVAHYGSDAQRVFVETPTGEINLPYEDVPLLINALKDFMKSDASVVFQNTYRD